MATLRDKKFEALVEAVESAVAWSGGVDFKWEGDVVMPAEFLADLLRLAFEAPAEDREAFIATLKEPEPA